MDHPLHAFFLLAYLLALIALGARKARSVKNPEDFSLAGRGLPAWILTGTLVATWIGTGSLFGNAEKAYLDGFATLLLPISGAVGIVVLYFIAARVRRMEKVTIQDILEERFGVVARLLGTLCLLSAYVIIVSYQYRAGAAVLAYVFPELDAAWATVFVALFVIAYTALAGMISVAHTDVANGVLMVIGLCIALPLLLSQAGGVAGVTEALGPERTDLFGTWSAFELISVLLPTLLLVLGDANMVQRFFSATTPGAAKRAAGGMFFGVLLLEFVILGVALAGRALVEQGALETPENPAHILLHVAFHSLPSLLGAMLVATAVAVVVSTADSYLLSPATSVVRDVVQRFVQPQASDRALVLYGRIVVLLLGLVALALAFTSDEFFGVALFAYTIYGATITPVLLAAYFWPRATPAGAVAAMLVGLASAISWRNVVEQSGPHPADWIQRMKELEIDAVLPATLASVLVLVVVSLFTSPRAVPSPAERGSA